MRKDPLKRDNKTIIIMIVIMIMTMMMMMMMIIEALCNVKLVMKFSSTPCYFLRLRFRDKIG